MQRHEKIRIREGVERQCTVMAPKASGSLVTCLLPCVHNLAGRHKSARMCL